MSSKKFLRFLLVPLLAAGALCLYRAIQTGLRSERNADVNRQWITSRYVEQGINPYEVCLHALRETYGEVRGPNRIRLRDLKIYDTSNTRWDTNQVRVLDAYGPPTSTYPPSSLLILYATVGRLPAGGIHQIWAVINICTLIALAVFGARMWRGSLDALGVATLLGICLAWPPTLDVFVTNQFSLIALLLLLMSVRFAEQPGKASQAAAGICLALALVKPSFALLFPVFFVLRGKWITVLIAGAIHVAGIFVMGALVHASPLAMVRQWLEISQYMLQGAYSVQEIINRMQWDNSALGSAITFGTLGGVCLWCLRYRRSGDGPMVSFIAVATLVWTYHERYDYVILLPVFFYFWETRTSAFARATWIALFALLGLALTDWAYWTDSPMCRLIRWGGRFSLLAILLIAAAAMRPARIFQSLEKNER